MTQPPTAPPTAPPAVPAVAPHQAAQPPAEIPPPAVVAPRRTAWAEGADRLRTQARTEPGRLRIIGAVLVGLLLLFGTVTAWQIEDRKNTATAVTKSSYQLSKDAADIYRALADAGTTAAAGFLTAEEPRAVRDRYELRIGTAARLLARAGANSQGSETAQQKITELSQQLPVYTGLVEAARANNRQGYPLGGAYLRYANDLMQTDLLPLAEELYALERARLQADLDDAREWPWFALGTGVLALGALAWAQRRHYQRTNRVFNRGLLTATAAGGVLLVWLVGAHGTAGASLNTADRNGAQSLHVLNEIWTGTLQARGDENLTLVARGAGAEFETSYQERMTRIAGGEESPGGLLGTALDLADDEAGRAPVQDAVDRIAEWRALHGEAMEADTSGDFETAVALVIGAEDSTGVLFDGVDESLADAVTLEEQQFLDAAQRGRGMLNGLAEGAGVLALGAAVATVLGIGRRLSEYR